MEMTNSRIVPAPPEKVWAALNDPDILKACLPGCETFERTGDDEWRAVMAARVGPVSARFTGTMRMTDSTPPTGYTLKFEGQGGAAGFANGEAKVTLAPAGDDQTALIYAVKATRRGQDRTDRLPPDRRRGGQDRGRFLRRLLGAPRAAGRSSRKRARW